ncbi:hypothetical protein F2Q70_00015410 [Brassica cretica]|uniref:Uncharacterized protein n=1 Tax=Brassica cretica TaxID=69181 RepID=A0A8S9HV52_BRACR|nr:hypothetical protein F2Q70_00015409 [Brassica cretica]KAF2564702.1 hypothetical protein F2Q70_00015410 [Brassica cretica]
MFIERERDAEKGTRLRRRKETRSNWKEKEKVWCLPLVPAMSEMDEGLQQKGSSISPVGRLAVDFTG